MTSLVGRAIKHYTIIEQIGQTNLTVVYRALDDTNQRQVAFKVIRRDAFTPQHFEEILERFHRTAQALINLSHPNIVRLLDYGTHRKTPYLVVDYIKGRTLSVPSGQPMHWHEAATILAPVARALEYAHSLNIVHGNVKPSNILICEDGTPMLTDFGMPMLLTSKRISTLEACSMGIGTPDYMAPEQLSTPAAPPTDIYSLGIIFFELVTATPPFHANTPAIALLKHVDQPLPDPRVLKSELPQEVAGILKSALAKQHSERYPSMGAFASALDKLAESAPPPPSIQLPVAIRPAICRRSVLLIAIAVITLTAIMYLATRVRLPSSRLQAPSPSTIITLTPVEMVTNTPFTAVDVITMPSLPNSRVTYDQPFDMPSIPDWVLQADSAIMDGNLRIVGMGNWQDLSLASREATLRQGEAALLLFRYRYGASFDLYLQSSALLEGGRSAALQWGVSMLPAGELMPHAYQGGENIGSVRWEGSLVPQPGPVYPLLLEVGGGTDFIARLWDIENPDDFLELHRAMPSSWSGLNWNFTAMVYNGLLHLDHYQELQLD